MIPITTYRSARAYLPNVIRVARVAELVPVLQIAIGPVILISGVGLLLLTMTNRLSRIIDRSRHLLHDLGDMPDGEERDRHIQQLRILTHRGALLRWAVGLAVLSVMLASVLIVTLFMATLLQLEIAWVISLIFIACLASLVGSAAIFLREVQRSLVALDIEIGNEIPREISAARRRTEANDRPESDDQDDAKLGLSLKQARPNQR